MKDYSLKNIKSKYILKQIIDGIDKIKLLKIIRDNKLLQEKLDLGLIDHKKYYEQIEIEIEYKLGESPMKEITGLNYFNIFYNNINKKIKYQNEDLKEIINIKDEDSSYYHVYYYLYFKKYENIKPI